MALIMHESQTGLSICIQNEMQLQESAVRTEFSLQRGSDWLCFFFVFLHWLSLQIT